MQHSLRWGGCVTASEFIALVESYYGRYERDAQRAMCLKWAMEVEYALVEVWSETLRTFSGQYGKTPDIAVFEKAASTYNNRDVVTGRPTSWRYELRSPPPSPLQIADDDLADPEEVKAMFRGLSDKMRVV
jgi:hypothetical protein